MRVSPQWKVLELRGGLGGFFFPLACKNFSRRGDLEVVVRVVRGEPSGRRRRNADDGDVGRFGGRVRSIVAY